tara:strand:- start:660 stop:977 length:318 start_codon:yes stop_codon:yes gene_type:complete
MDKAWLFVLGLVIAESGAQYFLQRAVSRTGHPDLVMGAALYVVVAFLYYQLLVTGDPMALANSVWNAGTEVSIALVGWFFFNQKLGGRQLLGIGVTMLGIHLLGA